MKRIKVLIFVIFYFSWGLFAQQTYYPIQCEGKIPADFIISTNTKIAIANDKYNRKQDGVSRKNYDEFNSSTNYYVDHLLKDGKIIFGSPMNDYVNKVGQLVLQNLPEIKDDIRFYIVKSTSVNAFTTPQGIVFINIGLIAQLENEAQLAFIISHELMHYKYKHSFESYHEEINAKASKGIYKKMEGSEKVDILMKYSRTQEMFADSMGFSECYSKTDYSYDEALSVFDVLLYSSLPFDEIKFDTAFFDDENYILDRKFILSEVTPVSTPEDYNDKYSSHPNIKKRRNMMIDLVTNFENPNDKKFLISKEAFLEMRKLARFEMSNLYLNNLQYDRAFYNSYLLLRKYPDNQFIKKSLAYCLYSFAIVRNFGLVSDVIQKYEEVEGNSQSVSYFFKKVDKKVVSALSVKFLWRYHKEYPQDEFMTKLLNRSIEFIKDKMSLSYGDIFLPKKAIGDSTRNNLEVISFKVLDEDEYNTLSKYDKIRYDKEYAKHYRTKRKDKGVAAVSRYRLVLSTESADKDFASLFKSIDTDSEQEANDSSKIVNRFILVNPLFFQLNFHKLDVKETEDNKQKLLPSLKLAAQKNSLDMITLDVSELGADDVDKFNDIALLNSWIQEYGELVEMEATHYSIPWQSTFMDSIKNKYNLRYISSTAMVSSNVTNLGVKIYFNIIGSLLLWQAAPYLLTKAFIKDNELYQVFFVADIESNELIFIEEEDIKGSPTADYLNLLNYNMMYSINNK